MFFKSNDNRFLAHSNRVRERVRSPRFETLFQTLFRCFPGFNYSSIVESLSLTEDYTLFFFFFFFSHREDRSLSEWNFIFPSTRGIDIDFSPMKICRRSLSLSLSLALCSFRPLSCSCSCEDEGEKKDIRDLIEVFTMSRPVGFYLFPG